MTTEIFFGGTKEQWYTLDPTYSETSSSSQNTSEDATPESVVYNQIGDTVDCFGLEITINSYEFVRCDNNNKYCRVSATIHNPSSDTITLMKSYASEYNEYIIYDTDYKYNSSWLDKTDYINSHDNIKPLETIDGIWQFEVPNVVAESKNKQLLFTFQENKWISDAVYSWELRSAATEE